MDGVSARRGHADSGSSGAVYRNEIAEDELHRRTNAAEWPTDVDSERYKHVMGRLYTRRKNTFRGRTRVLLVGIRRNALRGPGVRTIQCESELPLGATERL